MTDSASNLVQKRENIMSSFVSPAARAINLIRYIGDKVIESGKPISRLNQFAESIGAPSEELADGLLEELSDRGIVRMLKSDRTLRGTMFFNVDLTLIGWEQYDAERRGQLDGNYGFIAMQFGDPVLTSFVEDVVKPAVKKDVGYDLVDMKDIARAGVIDNIMREQIRGATFVIVDLTHDNPGAYWEAGYAEGLGKPVIYICEKEKFETQKTHFDTNHCTTVPWSKGDEESFCQNLTATILRSLN